MLKSLVSLEHIVEDKVYSLICAPDAPVAHVKEALHKFLSHCESVEQAAKQQAEKQPEVENV
jgi:hypothetical protein